MMNALINGSDLRTLTRKNEGRRDLFAPAVDVGETSDEFLIVANLPGMRPDEIDIRFENETLELSGRVEPQSREGLSLVRNERAVGDWRRAFDLQGCHINSENIDAKYKDGVLTVRLPKPEEARPRRIQVK